MTRGFVILIILVSAIFFLILVYPISSACYYSGYSGFLGSVLATFFAAFLVWVAWEELSKLSKTSSADFIHRLDNDFFTLETRILVSLIDCKALELINYELNKEDESTDENESLPYFEVNQNTLEKTKLPQGVISLLSKNNCYSTWEVDDLLLGLCENIGMLEQRGIVSFQMVYDVFSYYLELIWNYDHIKEYIRYCRKDDKFASIDNVFYNQFQYIAIKCIEYDNLHCGPCKWWWKVKRRFRGPKIEKEI